MKEQLGNFVNGIKFVFVQGKISKSLKRYNTAMDFGFVMVGFFDWSVVPGG